MSIPLYHTFFCPSNLGGWQIEKYIGIKELNYEILHELIDRIEVGEKYEYQGETYQDINIYYKFVGTVEFNSELNIEKAG